MNDQLLYLWVRRTSFACFEDDEFNFSPSYNFHFDKENNLLEEKPLRKINIFEKERNLSNLIAIIGNNGAGKTALLNCLSNISNKKNTKIEIKNGDALNVSDHFIAVFSIDGKFKVINRFTNNILFLSETENVEVEIETNEYDIDSFTYVYFSLESKTTTSFTLQEKKYFVPLTTRQIENDGNRFFSSKLFSGQKKEIDHKSFNFEKFWDTYFYSKHPNLIDSNPLINVSISHYNALLRSESKHKDGFISGVENVASSRHIIENSLASFLLFNLCLELNEKVRKSIIGGDYLIQNIEYDDILSFEELILRLGDYYSNKEMVAYVHKAITEIYQLDLVEKEMIQTIFPDEKYVHPIVSFNVNVGKLKKLFDLIVKGGPSFIFKYLSFNYERSDGEQAKLRQKAYLEYLAESNILFPDSYKLNKNIVILMDEIDIHLHPNEQRKLIKSVVESVNTFFDNKNVQIIITSHSPIVLSDLPSQNVLYIRKEEGENKRKIYRLLDGRTFGANIFDLYNDSFFFEDQVLMGDYAKKYIDDLYKRITETAKDERKQYFDEVNLIGEIIIRNELKNHITDEPIDQIRCDTEIIDRLKEQRAALDNLIKRLEDAQR